MFVISVFSLVTLTSHHLFWVRVSAGQGPPQGQAPSSAPYPRIIIGLVLIASAFSRALGYGFRCIISSNLLRWVLVPHPFLR